jgi:thiamine biosynthesis lipoprotein
VNVPLARGLLNPHSAEIRRARPLLGTLVDISATGPDDKQTNEAINHAFEAVQKVHALMSYHDPESDVSRINRYAFEYSLPVDKNTWRVLSRARDLAEASDGLFDITVAPALAHLGYLPRHAGFPKPSGQGSWRHVELLPGNRVRLARRLQIDLGGIAKGYAVDLAVHALEDTGMSAGRVNAGGDMRVFGTEPQVIHVRHPHDAGQMLPLMQIRHGSVATSASYYSERRQRGRWVTPLIHPATRNSCDVGRSVSVLAEDCMTADALTKVVHIDPALALDTLKAFNARALIMDKDPITGCCRMLHNEDGRWQVQLLPVSCHD